MNNRSAPRSRAGITLTLFAVLLLVLVAFVALAVDLSMHYTQLAQLQVTATSSAAGAALDLPSGAQATALRLARTNMPPAIHGAVLVAADIELGHWDEGTRSFTADGGRLNAVRVTTRRSEANGNPAPWLVAQVLRRQPIDMTASSTAVLLPELPGAIGATGSITVSGNALIDSYDSTDGPYDPATAGTNGDVVADGSISIGGSSTINGEVRGGDVSTGGNAAVSGSTSPLRRPTDFPLVDTTEISVDNDNHLLPAYQQGRNLISPLDDNGDFTLSGGIDYPIPAGDYLFRDLRIAGQSSLRVSGPTTIYLTGDLDTSGGDVINSTEDPNNLKILMTGGTAVINASVDWFGLLYAPESQVTIAGNGEVYGAIVGEQVKSTGTGDIHFDESLTISDVVGGISNRSSIVQ